MPIASSSQAGSVLPSVLLLPGSQGTGAVPHAISLPNAISQRTGTVPVASSVGKATGAVARALSQRGGIVREVRGNSQGPPAPAPPRDDPPRDDGNSQGPPAVTTPRSEVFYTCQCKGYYQSGTVCSHILLMRHIDGYSVVYMCAPPS